MLDQYTKGPRYLTSQATKNVKIKKKVGKNLEKQNGIQKVNNWGLKLL